MDDQSLKAITSDVENDLLNIIIQNLKQKSLDVKQAKALAKEFLSLLPIQDKKDLLEKLHKLSNEHVEVKSLYLKYAKPYEEEERQKKLALMSEHIKNGQIEHALNVAKGGTSNG